MMISMLSAKKMLKQLGDALPVCSITFGRRDGP
jgi:hypothetical protein